MSTLHVAPLTPALKLYAATWAHGAERRPGTGNNEAESYNTHSARYLIVLQSPIHKSAYTYTAYSLA